MTRPKSMRVILSMRLRARVWLSVPHPHPCAHRSPPLMTRSYGARLWRTGRRPDSYRCSHADTVQMLVIERVPSLFCLFMKCAASMWCCRVAHFACACARVCARMFVFCAPFFFHFFLCFPCFVSLATLLSASLSIGRRLRTFCCPALSLPLSLCLSRIGSAFAAAIRRGRRACGRRRSTHDKNISLLASALFLRFSVFVSLYICDRNVCASIYLSIYIDRYVYVCVSVCVCLRLWHHVTRARAGVLGELYWRLPPPAMLACALTPPHTRCFVRPPPHPLSPSLPHRRCHRRMAGASNPRGPSSLFFVAFFPFSDFFPLTRQWRLSSSLPNFPLERCV